MIVIFGINILICFEQMFFQKFVVASIVFDKLGWITGYGPNRLPPTSFNYFTKKPLYLKNILGSQKYMYTKLITRDSILKE